MSVTTRESLRFAINGDIPEPTVFAYDDYDGDNMTVAGFTGTITFRVDSGDSTTRSATVNEADATITVTWEDGDHTITGNGTGILRGEVALVDGTDAFWQRSFERVILPRLGG